MVLAESRVRSGKHIAQQLELELQVEVGRLSQASP